MKNRKSFFISPFAFVGYGFIFIAIWLIIVANGLNRALSNGFLCTPGSGAHGDFPNCPPSKAPTTADNISWWVAAVACWLGILFICFAIGWLIKRLTTKPRRSGWKILF